MADEKKISDTSAFGSPEESNKRYHYLLSQGVTELSADFDLPTQTGYDSDHPLAGIEVGKAGIAIDTLEDVRALFKGIELEKVSTSMAINATGFILLGFYIALARQQGADLNKLSGTIRNDILTEYATRGNYIYPPKPSMRLIADIFEYCSKTLPTFNPISISGHPIREAGSTAIQEIAFTLSNGKAYVKAAMEKGLDINHFGSRFSFVFSGHTNIVEETAKFHAARRIWASIMKELGATDPGAMMLRFQTDLRTRQIVAYERGVQDNIDPLAGSHFVDSLTDEVDAEAQKLIGIIDAMGGSVSAIEQGFIQDEIAKSAYEYQRGIQSGEKIIVGVNKFQVAQEDPIPGFRTDDSIRQVQTEKIAAFKNNRDPAKCDNLLQQLNDCASGDENIMPVVIEAVEQKCTLGEIADTLREVWGEHK